MLPDLLKDPESEAITRHRRRRPAFDIQSEGIATIRMTMNVHTDLLMSPSPSAIAVQRFLERCQRCRPDCVTIEIMRPKNLISCPKFVDYCISFRGGVQWSISHSKGVSKMEPPFRVGVEQNGTPLPLPIPTHLFCPFLPEHGGKVGFDLLQLGGSGFLLPVLGVNPVFLGNQGFIFRLQLGNGGQLL